MYYICNLRVSLEASVCIVHMCTHTHVTIQVKYKAPIIRYILDHFPNLSQLIRMLVKFFNFYGHINKL